MTQLEEAAKLQPEEAQQLQLGAMEAVRLVAKVEARFLREAMGAVRLELRAGETQAVAKWVAVIAAGLEAEPRGLPEEETEEAALWSWLEEQGCL